MTSVDKTLPVDGWEIPVYPYQAIVVGSGAAGYGAADALIQAGLEPCDVVLLSEARTSGTSRNTGSDKQTYYKLTTAGSTPDSVGQMAATLHAGGAVDGEHALAEAALSLRGFFRLVNYGVAFPTNEAGEYVGYKTDHDPAARGTSVGPYTSKAMTESLEAAVKARGIACHEDQLVVSILVQEGRAVGVLCLDLERWRQLCRAGLADAQALDPEKMEGLFRIYLASATVWCTGGPAGIYQNSVFPASQHGATGLAFAAGAAGKNLTEWQFGLASVKPRWNVSGSYMQVMPRLVSTAADGRSEEREFVVDYFGDLAQALDMVFLKGYQWPFDARRARTGSSWIDLLVYREQVAGRRVFLDYRSNPGGVEALPWDSLAAETRDYLAAAGAQQATPIRRLRALNEPAYQFYLEHGTDLESEPLEIALCAQHNNGGLAIDGHWETTLPGLFAVGEVAASHGVYRPGGSALNAGQVGGFRAADEIARRQRTMAEQSTALWQQAAVEQQAANQAVTEKSTAVEQRAVNEAAADQAADQAAAGQTNLQDQVKAVLDLAQASLQAGSQAETIAPYREQSVRFKTKMSAVAGAIRQPEDWPGFARELQTAGRGLVGGADPGQNQKLKPTASTPSFAALPGFFRYRDQVITQYVYLGAMQDYVEQGGKSRGSALYLQHSASGRNNAGSSAAGGGVEQRDPALGSSSGSALGPDLGSDFESGPETGCESGCGLGLESGCELEPESGPGSGCGAGPESGLEFELESEDSPFKRQVQISHFDAQSFTTSYAWRDARPLPEVEENFEKAWRWYRERQGEQ